MSAAVPYLIVAAVLILLGVVAYGWYVANRDENEEEE